MSAGRREGGALAIVLHTHMPYVEGFGTWPFGEEWLWEAIACCYLPLLELLDAGAPLTLSLTPVLGDQLECPSLAERFDAFVRDVRGSTHEQDAAGLRAGGHELLAAELDRAWGDYTGAAQRLRERGCDLLGAFAEHVQWASAATHAVLPLLASDAGIGLQVRCGVASHRRRARHGWGGGFWLPECAYAPWLQTPLEQAGVGAVCVELTRQLGLGAAEHLWPLISDAGIVLVPIDRATISLVWSDAGYPASGEYRDYHHHTVHHHNPWNNDGGAYDHGAALALARRHAADFVQRTRARLSEAEGARRGEGGRGRDGGLVVCALDTELLGHWWYEGVAWLEAVVEECTRQGLQLLRLDEALERHEPAPLAGLGPRAGAHAEHRGAWASGSWGHGGDLSTWSGPPVAEMAFDARAAELRVLRAGARAGQAAVRELLAVQASDWPFMVSRSTAVPYARERFAGHLSALQRALDAGPEASTAGLRNLARDADPRLLTPFA